MHINEPELDHVLRSAFARHGEASAFWLNGETYTYSQVFASAVALSKRILAEVAADATVGVLAQRSYAAYVGVLAAVLSGRPYVPINMKFPLERQISIATIGRCALLVFDDYSKRRCGKLLETLGEDVAQISPLLPDEGRVDAPDQSEPVSALDAAAVAYIMFTSGTTGTPKGVAVRRENLASYLAAAKGVAPIDPGTRCTQLFDLSFDLSVHDIFHTWANGGCLYVMGNEDALDPVGFASRHALQAWFSVPSVVAMARRLKRLQPNLLPEMRLSLFCGEPLPVSIADAWAEVAPNSRILNLYGPTEATIAITAQEYVSSPDAGKPASVPLGKAFEHCAAVVVDDSGKPAAVGELWLAGAQISNGYINNDDENRKKFVSQRLPGHPYDRWYRTGDLVRMDDRHGLVFQGRLDEQTKIQGYRVELLEIEEVLRRVSGSAEVAATPWPLTETGSAEGVVGFVCSTSLTAREIVAGCRIHLPSYAAPRKIVFVDALPLNANGKVDRNALRAEYLNQAGEVGRSGPGS